MRSSRSLHRMRARSRTKKAMARSLATGAQPFVGNSWFAAQKRNAALSRTRFNRSRGSGVLVAWNARQAHGPNPRDALSSSSEPRDEDGGPARGGHRQHQKVCGDAGTAGAAARVHGGREVYALVQERQSTSLGAFQHPSKCKAGAKDVKPRVTA